MRGIGEFFKKIQGAYAQEIALRERIRHTLISQTAVDIPIQSILVLKSVVKLTGISSAARSEIYIKKLAIMHELNKAGSGPIITDIT